MAQIGCEDRHDAIKIEIAAFQLSVPYFRLPDNRQDSFEGVAFGHNDLITVNILACSQSALPTRRR
jgi:hypothetical protein